MKLAAPLVALLLAAPQDAKVELRLKYEKGQVLRYKTVQKTVTEAAGNSFQQQMGFVFSMKVEDVASDGAATLKCTYEAVSVKATGLQDLDYDSEKDKEVPDEPMLQMVSKLVGQSFVMKMTPAGRVTDVKGFDKILEAMMAAAGDEQARQMAKQMLQQVFSDDAFKSMMQQMSPVLPDGKVGRGDTWTNDFSIKLPMLGAIKYSVQSRLADLQGKSAQIDQDIKLELKPGENEDNPLAGLFELKSSKGRSSCVFAVDRGLFLSQKVQMEMTLSAGGQEMPIKSEAETTLVEKK